MNISPINSCSFKAIYVTNDKILTDAQNAKVSQISEIMNRCAANSKRSYSQVLEDKGYDLILQPADNDELYMMAVSSSDNPSHYGYSNIHSDVILGKYNESIFNPDDIIKKVNTVYQNSRGRDIKILSYLIGITIIMLGAIISMSRKNSSNLNNGTQVLSTQMDTIIRDTVKTINIK